jgi:hypothetical protein
MSKSPTLKRKKLRKPILAMTPARGVKVGGDGGSVVVEDFGVAVVGNGVPIKPGDTNPANFQGQAQAGLWGAAIAGDNAGAAAAKGCVALAGTNGHASVGDGGMARSSNGGFANGYWNSIALVDDAAWAVAYKQGIAIARIGLAQTFENGIAGAFAQPSADGGVRGISIAGPAGIALAFEEGVLVQAGAGGVLAGFWQAPDKGVRLAVQAVDAAGSNRPDTLYKFEGGKFVGLSQAETTKAQGDIARWKKPWLQTFEKARKRSLRKADS